MLKTVAFACDMQLQLHGKFFTIVESKSPDWSGNKVHCFTFHMQPRWNLGYKDSERFSKLCIWLMHFAHTGTTQKSFFLRKKRKKKAHGSFFWDKGNNPTVNCVCDESINNAKTRWTWNWIIASWDVHRFEVCGQGRFISAITNALAKPLHDNLQD